jgi:hypothetical protein
MITMRTTMKKSHALALLSMVAVFPTVGAAADGEAEIKRLNDQEVQALLHQDVKTMEHLWSADFVVTNPFNQFVNKRQVIGLTQSGVLAFTSYERSIEYIRIDGGTAIVAGAETLVWAGKMPAAGKTSHLRFTAVWMKHAGGWQEVARHANIVPDQLTAVPAIPR